MKKAAPAFKEVAFPFATAKGWQALSVKVEEPKVTWYKLRGGWRCVVTQSTTYQKEKL